MKRKVFIQLSNETAKMTIGTKRKYNALDTGYGSDHQYKPTITLELNLDIPNEFFDKAQKEIDIKVSELNIDSGIKIEEVKKDE